MQVQVVAQEVVLAVAQVAVAQAAVAQTVAQVVAQAILSVLPLKAAQTLAQIQQSNSKLIFKYCWYLLYLL